MSRRNDDITQKSTSYHLLATSKKLENCIFKALKAGLSESMGEKSYAQDAAWPAGPVGPPKELSCF